MSQASLKRKQSSRTDLFAHNEEPIVQQNKAPRTHSQPTVHEQRTPSPRTSSRRPALMSPSPNDSQEEDDSGSTMQRVVEQIQLASKKKTSKYKAKMEVVVEQGLKNVETAVAKALREEEAAYRQSLSQLHSEFKNVTQGLQQWANSVHELNTSYNLSMKGLASQFDKLTRAFSEQLKAISRDALAPDAAHERQERVQRECRALIAAVKSEIQQAPEPAKGGAQTAMLLQALVNSMT